MCNFYSEETRRKREEVTIQLRRSVREDKLGTKRRSGLSGDIIRSFNDEDLSTAAKTATTSTTSTTATAAAALAAETTETAAAAAGNTEIIKRIDEYVDGVRTGSSDFRLTCVIQLRKLLSIENRPPLQEVINTGIIPQMIDFLGCNDMPELQFEAAWVLTNIASGTSKHTRAVIDAGAVPHFVRLLRCASEDVREQAVWALGNIAGDSPQCRDYVLSCGALAPMMDMVRPTGRLGALRNITWAISNFCRGDPSPPLEMVGPTLSVLRNLIKSKDEALLIDACWALSYLSDDKEPDNLRIQAVVNYPDIIKRLVELLMHKNIEIKVPVVRTIGNIATGDEFQTQALLDVDTLPCLLALLVNPKANIRKEACWTISNITAGTHQQIQAVIDAGFIQPIIAFLKTGEFKIKKEALWAISNAMHGGNREQIQYMVEKNALPPICDMLDSPEPQIIIVAIDAIKAALKMGRAMSDGATQDKMVEQIEECGGLDKIEALQRHDNHDIYEAAVRLIQDYFDPEETDDVQALEPARADNQFLFTSGLPGGFGAQNISNVSSVPNTAAAAPAAPAAPAAAAKPYYFP